MRREITVVTSGVQDVTGEEALRPEQATVLGPCKVIPQEYPGLACRSVDLVAADAAGWDDASAAQLLRELRAGGDDKVVAYRGGRRWVDSHEAWPLPPVAGRPPRLREGGVYLVTGALGGIGLEVAETLAREARARLVLVSRGALPARPEWERWIETHGDGDELARRLRRLRALEAHGAEVLAAAGGRRGPGADEEGGGRGGSALRAPARRRPRGGRGEGLPVHRGDGPGRGAGAVPSSPAGGRRAGAGAGRALAGLLPADLLALGRAGRPRLGGLHGRARVPGRIRGASEPRLGGAVAERELGPLEHLARDARAAGRGRGRLLHDARRGRRGVAPRCWRATASRRSWSRPAICTGGSTAGSA